MENIWQKLSKPIYCLAPMEDVTDTVFRQLLVNIGKPDLMFSEFTNVHSIYSHSQDTRRLEYTPKEKPLILQVWGLEPAFYFQGAQLAVELGFDGIDINMGCPQKKIIKKGACSALINNPQLAIEIIQATQAGTQGKIPVSVKTRIGFKQVVTEEWASCLLNQNIQALIIHGRTSVQMSKVPADWNEIKKVVDLRNSLNKSTLIIGNGDIVSLDQADQKVAQTGVDGVMIGRGIFHNPWLFSSQPDKKRSKTEKLAVLLQHVTLWRQTWGNQQDFNRLKRFFKIYVNGFSEASQLRSQLMACSHVSQVEEIVIKSL